MEVCKFMVTKNDHTLINSVVIGDSFDGVYIIKSAFEKIARNNNPYCDFLLGDKSGQAYVRFWGPLKDIKCGDWLAIIANVTEYNGNAQIIAQRVEKSDPPTEQEMENYILKSTSKEEDIKKFDKYISRVKEICDLINDQTCKIILESIFTTEFRDKFFNSPLNDKTFYGMNGGLLSHTIKTSYIVGGVASQYGFENLEVVISITAALLHKIGAIDSYQIKNCQSLETKESKLHSMKLLTLYRFMNSIKDLRTLEGFKEETASRIQHCLEAQDCLGIQPLTKEAVLLSEVMDTDIKLTSAIDVIDNDNNDEEFTSYDPNNKRYFYKGKKNNV